MLLLPKSNQVFRSTQIPVITEPKGDNSLFHKSQLDTSDIKKNEGFFGDSEPTQMLLLFKRGFVLKIRPYKQIHWSVTDTRVSNTESAPPPAPPYSTLLCFTRKTKASALVLKAIQKASWLRFLRYHHIFQPSHRCYYSIFSFVFSSQVIMEMPTLWGTRQCRII